MTQGQITLFIAECRRRQLIRGEDGATAWAWLQDTFKAENYLMPPETPGKTAIENIVSTLRKCTQKQFNGTILPGVRSI
jgi:hypothetical protein